ncbi:hypothetical protein OAL58_03815 [Verrucomicrobia bacterium]|nr:hypothetical protein [Verrucomicrobiota bacterium]
MKPLSSPYLKEIQPRGLVEKLMVLMRFAVVALIVALSAYILKFLLGLVTPQIHDEVFLQLEGSLYAKYFPFSLVCLSIFSLLVIYNIFAFVSGKSLVRSAYIWLVRRFLYTPGFGNVIIIMARVTRLLGLKPKLLEDIITTDCALCLDNLIHSSVIQDESGRLVVASELLLKITELTQPSVDRQLKNVGMMLRSLLIFELRTGDSPSSPHAKKIAFSGLQLIELLKCKKGNANALEPDLWPCSFRFRDLLDQVAFIFKRQARIESVAGYLANSNDLKPLADLDRLMQCHHQREKLIVDVGLKVEECFFTEGRESMPEVADLIDNLVDKDPETVRASGSLSHGVALYLSVASGREGIICRYQNSVGALRFCAELIDESDPSLAQCKSGLIHLSASLDEPWGQGLLAEIQKTRFQSRRGDWVDSVFKESEILTREDFEYAAQQVESENMYAGPDFNGASRSVN